MRIASAVLLSLGVGLLLAAVAYGAYGVWFRSQAEEVTGTVVEVRLTAFSDGNAYCPVIRYRSHTGQNFTHFSNICSWPSAYEQGEKITLWFERSDPEHVQLDGFLSKWLASAILGFVGVVLSLVGVSMFAQEYGLQRVMDVFKRQG